MPNFSLTEKCFPLTNFSNGKQTQENLKNDFPETTFQKTNAPKPQMVYKVNLCDPSAAESPFS